MGVCVWFFFTVCVSLNSCAQGRRVEGNCLLESKKKKKSFSRQNNISSVGQFNLLPVCVYT